MSPTPPPTTGHKAPLGVWLGLAFAVCIDTVVQLVWSKAATDASSEATLATLLGMFSHPLFYAMLGLYAMQFVNWMIVLSKADLSFAQPITACSYVLTAAGSAYFLADRVTPLRMAGIALILIGVWLISGTTHHTGAPSMVHPVTDSLEDSP
ncbi:EamA family transporter [Candidatus Methylomirabilis sp.]|uniref:EamA family transporter n=1 Tax=Candidatus Methylomirabilis sp. TaxID=2032687 RepID=UPI002A6586AC|nr:EamA family transporter [Candidatus Methylomirabilis sp.]